MRLLAISDLHLSKLVSLDPVKKIANHLNDWLILAGDIAENTEFFAASLEILASKFAKLIWVPGNHELWTEPAGCSEITQRGLRRYECLVDIARAHGVVTPEDDYLEWPGSEDNDNYIIAPLFLLYDYSLRPDDISRENLRKWVRQIHAECTDELRLHCEPYNSKEEWCWARCAEAEKRLESIPRHYKTILINHWPLRSDLIYLPRLPRFIPWCGTKLTHSWHKKYNAAVVVSGHLHTRRTDFIDGCRFEEVSLGYKRQWDVEKGIDFYFREIISN
tara:strand:+ start:604 stop:1431 length:828 start_codon:yes stop_codon:yes gene_type:complete